jgi:hypothetical protein
VVTDTPTYAWCFDHGNFHHFARAPWCTARWVPLAGASLGEAVADRAARFGEARLYNELPIEQQLELIGLNDSREEQP